MDRAAIDTIRGYFYQFDMTILQILSQTDGNTEVLVEGIEDVDIITPTETTAIQCKYYESTEYNHSVIKSAVVFLVEHYSLLRLMPIKLYIIKFMVIINQVMKNLLYL